MVAVFEVVGLKRGTVSFRGTKMKGRFALLTPKQTFKGVAFGGQAFYADLGGTNTTCEVNVKKGELILVYAYGLEPIGLSSCGPWGNLAGMLRDIRYLFEITEPESPKSGAN